MSWIPAGAECHTNTPLHLNAPALTHESVPAGGTPSPNSLPHLQFPVSAALSIPPPTPADSIYARLMLQPRPGFEIREADATIAPRLPDLRTTLRCKVFFLESTLYLGCAWQR